MGNEKNAEQEFVQDGQKGYTGDLGDASNNSESAVSKDILGYFINYGTTSCRIFEISKDGKTLSQKHKISYDVSDTSDVEAYLENIIRQTNETIIPIIGDDRKGLFIKTFADNNFKDIIADADIYDDFLLDFYKSTRLSFNVLTDEQTENNIRAQFGAVCNDGVIINIGSTYVDIFARPDKNSNFKLYSLALSLKQVESFISESAIGEIWKEEDISRIKKHIKSLIPKEFPDLKASSAYILKNEATFMTNNGYRLTRIGNEQYIKYLNYKKDNRTHLFGIDYKARLENLPESEQKNAYGFKIGHIILETLFETMGVKNIYPSDLHSIHGNADAYIFNVVIGGSTSQEYQKNMLEACQLFEKMGAQVISPTLVDGLLTPQDEKTHNEHLKAIRRCDLLFVSNKDGYFGEQTYGQIYLARGLYKPIAFWKELTEDELKKRNLEFIPHECWETKMNNLLNGDNH